jgi:nucleotide-binding universal stress UspA family protein
MAVFRSVLCAIDLSDMSARAIYHAAGLVGASGARFTILHVSDRPRAECELEVQRVFIDAVPYGATYLAETSVQVAPGEPVEVIRRVACERAADLIVCGSRARTGLARLLLASTTAGLLQRLDRPLFLVGPTDRDVVTLGIDRVGLNFGAVIVAIDLAAPSHPQLGVASELAALSHQKLLAMTVARHSRSDHDVASDLRARAHSLEPAPVHAVIVRRGDIAQEIARCAAAERAGLVVMGLASATGRRSPGSVAIAVLQTRRAHVLVVPGDWTARDAAPS